MRRTVRHTTARMPGRGLTLHMHRFEPAAPSDTCVLLLHGFMDAGGTWTRVAQPLSEAGFEVVAPDFRGFGASDRVPPGGYYHFADYVADVAALVEEIDPDKLFVVGHSMGGTVATYFAGATSRDLAGLVLLEGIGPPGMGPELGPTRMRTWLRQLERPKTTSPLASVEAAVSRLAANHTAVPKEMLAEVAEHLVTERDGALHWCFDSLHRTTSPSLFREDQFRAFLEEITCPVLFVGGGDTGWHPLEEADRVACLKDVKRVDLAGAGHMMHWTQPGQVADAVLTFIRDRHGR